MNSIPTKSIKYLFIGVVAVLALFVGIPHALAEPLPGVGQIDIEPTELPERVVDQLVETKSGNFIFRTIAGYAFQTEFIDDDDDLLTPDIEVPLFDPNTGVPVPSDTDPLTENPPVSDIAFWPIRGLCPPGSDLEGQQCGLFYWAFILLRADENGDPISAVTLREARINVLAERHLVGCSANGFPIPGAAPNGKETSDVESTGVRFLQPGPDGQIFGSCIVDDSKAGLVTAKAINRKLRISLGTQGAGVAGEFLTLGTTQLCTGASRIKCVGNEPCANICGAENAAGQCESSRFCIGDPDCDSVNGVTAQGGFTVFGQTIKGSGGGCPLIAQGVGSPALVSMPKGDRDLDIYCWNKDNFASALVDDDLCDFSDPGFDPALISARGCSYFCDDVSNQNGTCGDPNNQGYGCYHSQIALDIFLNAPLPNGSACFKNSNCTSNNCNGGAPPFVAGICQP